MAWQQYDTHYLLHRAQTSVHAPFRINHKCFIRKEHECGKAFGASKSCFVACPDDDDLGPALGLLSEKLSKHGIEQIVAVKERAYGQDIFCTKICGKIIEAKFCVVFLDDAIVDGKNIPNPNVYYEYGLMTALSKHIIPLQKDKQKLAFNIQSYDTIKYKPKNLATELERAIRDAIRISESNGESNESSSITDKQILRKLELNGFTQKDRNWLLNSAIEDTQFRGFGYNLTDFYLYLGKVDTEDDAKDYLDDLDIVLVRTARKADEMHKKLRGLTAMLNKLRNELGDKYENDRFLTYDARQAKKEVPDLKGKLASMKSMYVGFLLNPELDSTSFRERVENAVAQFKQFTAVFSSESCITIGKTEIDYSASST